MSRIVGLDLSLTSSGVVIVDTGSDPVWSTHRIESKGKASASLSDRSGRLNSLRGRLTELARTADLVVVESPAFSRTVGSMHDRSGLWWLIIEELITCGIPVADVTPSGRAKYGSGKGNAGKDEVLAAAVRRYPEVPIIGNDIADATILAAMGARHLGEPVEASLPVAHLAAMDAVVWPRMFRAGHEVAAGAGR